MRFEAIDAQRIAMVCVDDSESTWRASSLRHSVY